MKKIAIEVRCPFCGHVSAVSVNEEDYFAWGSGELAQNCFPYLDASEREILISGLCFKSSGLTMRKIMKTLSLRTLMMTAVSTPTLVALRMIANHPFFFIAALTIGSARNFHYTTSRTFCQVKIAKKLHKHLSQNQCKIPS